MSAEQTPCGPTMLTRLGWFPAIPEPYSLVLKHCACGASFWTENGYRGHYVLVHILGADR